MALRKSKSPAALAVGAARMPQEGDMRSRMLGNGSQPTCGFSCLSSIIPCTGYVRTRQTGTAMLWAGRSVVLAGEQALAWNDLIAVRVRAHQRVRIAVAHGSPITVLGIANHRTVQDIVLRDLAGAIDIIHLRIE